MDIRIVWVRCPDCGRHGTDGGCYTVESRPRFWPFWSPLLVEYDYGGRALAAHYPTEEKARAAAWHALHPPKQASDRVVVSQWSER